MKKQLIYISSAILFSVSVSAQKMDINAMPKSAPSPKINIQKPQSFQLRNGLTVLVVENNKLPRVNVSLSIDRAPVYEGNLAGISSIMSDQLGKGTTKMSKDAFNNRVDYLGARVNFSSTGFSCNSLSKYFPEIFGLMSDSILNPLFTEKEVNKSKERSIEGLKTDEKSADAIADKVSKALIFGKNTARGEFETAESINKIKVADVVKYFKSYYAPNNAYLVIVGDVKFADVKTLVEKNFSAWQKSTTIPAKLVVSKNLTKSEINIVDIPNAVQSVIKVGNLNDVQMKDPIYIPATIANYVLGGGGEGRLFSNLREKNAFTYDTYSIFNASKYGSIFSAESSVRNEVTDKAIKEFLIELNDISTIKEEELANAKAKLKGSFIMSLEKPETIARFAVNQKLQNLPDNYYTNYLQAVDKVSLSDLKNAVKQIIMPKQSRIFVAGKVSEIADNIEKLGFPVKYYDSNANPVAKPEVKKIEASTSLSSIAEKNIAATGGRAKMDKINNYVSLAGISVQGQNIDIKIAKAKGGKEMNLLTMMGQTIQKDVFDGKTGYKIQMGQKSDLTKEEIDVKLSAPELFEIFEITKPGKFELAGVEKINGEEAYVVKSKNIKYYFSIASGLKIADAKTESQGGKSITLVTTYSDYKEVEGIKFPFTFGINQMGMEMQIKVKSYELNKATEEDFK